MFEKYEVGQLYATRSGAVVKISSINESGSANATLINDTSKSRGVGYNQGQSWNFEVGTGEFIGGGPEHVLNFKKLLPKKDTSKNIIRKGQKWLTNDGTPVTIGVRHGNLVHVRQDSDSKTDPLVFDVGSTWSYTVDGLFNGEEHDPNHFMHLKTLCETEKESDTMEQSKKTSWDDSVKDEVEPYVPATPIPQAPPAPSAGAAQGGFDAMFQSMVLGPAYAKLEQLAKTSEASLTKHLVDVQKEIDRRLLDMENKPIQVNIKVANLPEVKKEGYIRPEFKDALLLAANRINTLLVGPAGSGKTHLAREVAEALKLRFSSISCSAGMSESQLTGWLLPTGEKGKFEYVKSNFIDVYENGGVFLFDEMDAADSNTLLFINQALSSEGFSIPQRFENPYVKRHPDCIIIAAANTYGTGANMMYSGRDRLDESTLDRFRAGIVQMGYDAKLEKSLIKEEILTWGQKVRDGINKAKLNRVMSTRFLLDANKLHAAGKSISQIKEIYFTGWSTDERAKIAV